MPEVRGWNNMPTWAKVLSAPVYANQLGVEPFVNLMNAAKGAMDWKGDINASNAVDDIAKMGTPEQVQNYDTGYMPAEKRMAINKLKQDRIEQLYAQDPLALAFAKMQSTNQAEGNAFDPNFTGAEWQKGMATTPALGGVMSENQYDSMTGALPAGKTLQTTQGQNPVLARAIQQGELAAQNQANTSRVADATFKGVAPNMNDLTSFLTTGSGQMTTGEKGTGGASLYDKILAGARQTNEAVQQRATGETLNTVGMLIQSPDFQSATPEKQIGLVMEKTGITDPSKLESILKTANIIKDMKLEEVGAKAGTELRKKQFVDKFGRVGGTAGETFLPSAPKVSVTNQNYLPPQETSYGKKRGEALAERESDIIKKGDVAEETLQLVGDLREKQKKAYSGNSALVMPGLTRVTGGLVGNKEKAAATTAAENINSQFVLNKIRTLGANPTDTDRKFLEKMQSRTNYTKQEQQQLLDMTEKYAKDAIAKRNNLVNGTVSDLNPQSEKGLKLTTKPQTRPPLSSFRR